MGLVQNYKYCSTGCNTGSLFTITATLSLGGCYVVTDGYSGADFQHTELQDLTFSIPSALPCDLTLRYSQSVSGSYSVVNHYTIVIPAGSTSVVLTSQLCYDNLVSPDPGSSQTEYYTYDLEAQTVIPTCSMPFGCTLAITGSTYTAPSLLGASDGSLKVYISGATGSVTYRINGGTPQASNTFTSIPAGYYNIRVDDSAGCYATKNITIPNGAFISGPFSVITPQALVASENPILYTISTPVKDGSSIQAISTLTVSNLPEDNYKLRFSLTSPASYSVDFYAKSYPNKSVYFLASTLKDNLGVFIKVNTATEVANSLGQVLQNDLVFSKNYYINTSGNTVQLVAKQPSSRFTITSSNISTFKSTGVVTATGITLTVNQAGTDFYSGALLDNYKLYTEVYSPSDNVEYGTDLSTVLYNRITEVQLPYQLNNLHKFDISEICKSFVSTPKPDYELSGFTTNISYLQPFYVKYGEVYAYIANTSTLIKNYKGKSGSLWVSNAALNYEQANDFRTYTGVTIGGYTRNIPFLTNSPKVKRSSRRQRELLYFIIKKNLNEGVIDVKGTVTFWDGTFTFLTSYITITTNAFNFGGAITINVSFDKLGLDVIELNTGKLIKQLDIAVYSTIAGLPKTLTETKSYTYNLEEHSSRVGISWLNKLGTFDSFDFYGTLEENVIRESKLYSVPRVIQTDGSSPYGFKSRATYDTKVTKKFNLSSGYIPRATFDWMLELLSSNEVYVYSTAYDNFINITAYKYAASSNENTYSLEIEGTYTLSENNVSI